MSALLLKQVLNNLKMYKVISSLLEDVKGMNVLSAISVSFFFILFMIVMISVIRMRKEHAEEMKNMPLNDSNSNDEI
jgi:cbb3-type cytochrome oxidase subunit 3